MEIVKSDGNRDNRLMTVILSAPSHSACWPSAAGYLSLFNQSVLVL